MPATTEYQQGGNIFGRISIRRNQVSNIDVNHEQELEDIDLFQKNVADRFSDLLPPPPSSADASADISSSAAFIETILSVSWLRKLLDIFLCCEAEFKAVLILGRDPSQIVKPPLDRLIPELLDRSVKALDICNAIGHGVESVRHWQKLAEIAVGSLSVGQRPYGEGQVRRARKALNSLLASMLIEDKETNTGSNKSTERTWSFGRRGGNQAAAAAMKGRDVVPAVANVRTMSKNWSASKQIQAMTSNLLVPRGNEASGLALPVYIMSSVMVFVMWALVASVPCQERTGLTPHLPVPRQLGWAHAMIGLQERISEEWKKKEKKGAAGLMEEVARMEKLAHNLMEFCDSFKFPMEEEKEEEVAAQIGELGEICKRMEEGLVPMQLQIREVFHRIVRSRTEVLELIDHSTSGRSSAPIM